MNYGNTEPVNAEQSKLEAIFEQANNLNDYAFDLKNELFQIKNKIYKNTEEEAVDDKDTVKGIFIMPETDFVGKTGRVLHSLLLNLRDIQRTVDSFKEIV